MQLKINKNKVLVIKIQNQLKNSINKTKDLNFKLINLTTFLINIKNKFNNFLSVKPKIKLI